MGRQSAARVLVVEDESIVAMELKSRLQDFGYEVTGVASSGPEALRLLEESPPDLVLLDVLLDGDMDGIQVGEHIRDGAAVPVIYLTAYDDPATMRLAEMTRPYGYIIKPFHPRDLRMAIEVALYRSGIEHRLKESEGRFRELAENVRDVFYLVDLVSGQLLYVNPAYERISGRTCESLYARPDSWIDLVHPRDRDRVTRAVSGRTGEDVECRIVRPDGTVRWIQSRNTLVHDARGLPARIAGVAEDVTDLKRAERLQAVQLATSRVLREDAPLEEALPRVLEVACPILDWPFGAAWTVPPGGEAARCVGAWHSDADPFEELKDCYRSTALKSGQGLAGRAWEQGAWVWLPELPPEDAFYCAGGATQVGVVGGLALPMQLDDGTTCLLEFLDVLMPEPDLPTLEMFQIVAGQIRQFSGRIQAQQATRVLEEQLRQSHKMEAIGRLAGGVAHDFNNMLTVILGYAEVLLHRLPPGDAARAELQEIFAAGTRATDLTRQLLAFSRKQVLQPRLLDLNQVVASVDKMLRRLIGEDILLATVLDPALGTVRADPGQIEQVVINLAVNARDAMPSGGHLTLRTDAVTLGDAYSRPHADILPGPYALLSVTDTGCGMDEATLAHIFEPFFTTKEQGHGTGLGLSMVYGIVRQSGGHVEVRSAPGTGTTFRIYLPLETSPEKVTPNEGAKRAPRAGGEVILLVDDDDGVRRLTRTLLEASGYLVVESSGPLEALKILEQRPGRVDLLLTDVVMPVMSGVDLRARVAERHPDVKCVLMSGYTDDRIAPLGACETSTGLLDKPFTAATLTGKVREALEGSRGIP